MPYQVDAQGNVIPEANPAISSPTTTIPPREVFGEGDNRYRIGPNGTIEWLEPARPEGINTWTHDQLYAWAAAHPTAPPPAGVPARALWDPVRRDWYEIDPGQRDWLNEGPDWRFASTGRSYFNQGANPLAGMYQGGTYLFPNAQGVPQVGSYGGRLGAIPYSVPTTSIRGTLRYGDTGYRGPAPPPEPASLSLAPERPLGVPENWVWDPTTNAWRPPQLMLTAPGSPAVVGVNTRGRNTELGSTTETAAPRFTATPPNEVPPVDLYNNNQDGTVSPPGTPGPVAMWNYNSPNLTRPSPEDMRDATLGYIGNRIQYAGMA